MLSKERSIAVTSLLIFSTGLLSHAVGQNLSKNSPEGKALELKSLLASIEGIAKEPPQVFKTKEGYLRFIGAPPSTYFAVAAETPEQVASAFLERWRTLFVSDSPAVGFDVKRVKNRNSRSYVRYQQKYAGLEIFGAEVIIQVNAGNKVVAVISDIMRDTDVLDTKKVSLEPAIDASTAQKKGIEFLAKKHQKLEFVASEPILIGHFRDSHHFMVNV